MSRTDQQHLGLKRVKRFLGKRKARDIERSENNSKREKEIDQGL